MRNIIKGKVIKFGDNINTDIIYPGRFINITEAKEMAEHAFQGISDDFPGKFVKSPIIVAGANFGCGSSREQAAICLKYAKVTAIIAKGFGRIFFRNAINHGLPAIICPDAVENISDGDSIKIDFQNSIIYTNSGQITFQKLPDFIMDIIKSGNLVNYTLKNLRKN